MKQTNLQQLQIEPENGNLYSKKQIDGVAEEVAKKDNVERVKTFYNRLNEGQQQQFIRSIVPVCFKRDSAGVLEYLLAKINPTSETQIFLEAIKNGAIKIAIMYIEKRSFIFNDEIKQWIGKNKSYPKYEKTFILLDKYNIDKAINEAIEHMVNDKNFNTERKAIKI